MILLGHPDLPCPPLILCHPHHDLSKTPTGSIIITHFASDRIPFYQKLSATKIPYGVFVQTLPEVLLGFALKIPYLLCSTTLAPQFQKSADDYLVDSKIVAVIDNQREIAWAATRRIDGIIFRQSLVEYEVLISS